MAFTQPTEAEITARITAFLEERLGLWPPTQRFHLITHPMRDEPRWDGSVVPVYGIETPEGTVISCSPTRCPDPATLDTVRLEDELEDAEAYLHLPSMLNLPDARFGRYVMRYMGTVPDMPEIGEWVAHDDPRLPEWLRPFLGDVLVVWDEQGDYASGVGLKKHSALGIEISVGTEPSHRGRGYARMLVAQAARAIWSSGATPIYNHGDHNAASARTAEAAGFPDRGWHVVQLT